MNRRLVSDASALTAAQCLAVLRPHLDPELLRALYPELFRVSRAGIETAVLAHERLESRLRPVAAAPSN